MRRTIGSACALVLTWMTASARAEVRQVGPGKPFATPCAAFQAAADGDTIEIDAAGQYVGDVCAITKNRLLIRGTGGRPHIEAGGKSAGGKAIWVIQGSDTTVEDVELSGCSVPDQNGAGIRQEGRNLTIRRSYFHDNENGLLGGADAESEYLIEDSEFANNGAGDGQSHNMYIGVIKRFTLRGSYSHHAKVGHLVKSRALSNYILYNRLSDETGNASYQLDLSQGGPSVVLGNVLHKSKNAQNSAFISYARESNVHASSALWVASNTFYNERMAGTFIAVARAIADVTVRNNIFTGPGTVCDQPAARLESNLLGDAAYVDPARYDFRLQPGSPAVDGAGPAGTALGESLAPVCQYAHPARALGRKLVGALDQGSFELNGESELACGQAVVPAPDAGGATDAGAPASAGDAGAPPAALPDAGGDAALRDPARPDAATGLPGDMASDPDARSEGGCRASGSGPLSSLLSSCLLALACGHRQRRRRLAHAP